MGTRRPVLQTDRQIFVDTPTSSSSVLGTCEILLSRYIDGIHNHKSGNIYPFCGNGLFHKRNNITILPSLYKDIGVDAMTASYLCLWIYKTHPPTCVSVGEISKTGRLSSIKQESRTHSGILSC